MSMTMMGVEDAQGTTATYPTANLILLVRADMGVVKAGGGTAADGDLIQTWQDQSGAANDLTADVGHRPTFKSSVNPLGGPAIRFDGSTNYFTMATPFTPTGHTMYAALKPNVTGAQIEVSIISGDIGSFYWRIDGSTKKAQIVRSNQALVATATNAYTLGSWAQGNVSTNNSDVIFRKDSAADGTVTGANPAPTVVSKYVGTDNGGNAGTEYMYQDLACLLAYSTVHDTATRQQVEGWLTSKFGV